MVFREHTYGVLVVSSSEKFNSTMKTLLPMTDYWPLDFAGSVSEARRRMLETEYDLVLINAPLPDDFGTRLATSICNETGLGVPLSILWLWCPSKMMERTDILGSSAEKGSWVIICSCLCR